MPDWNKVWEEIAAAEKRVGRRPRPRTTGRVCQFWDCAEPIRSEHFLCYEHYVEFQDGLVDECPACTRAKHAQYDVCLECYNDPPKQTKQTKQTKKTAPTWYKREYSSAWDAKDAETDQFFVYILKLDGGKFYAGQSRDLRARLSEHRDGQTQSTARRNPKLVWFGGVPSRDQATGIEAQLKQLIDRNPREIRKMVIAFRDLVGELDYT